MAWGEPDIIKFDSQAISDMKTKINETSNTINSEAEKILEAVTNLEKEWQTPEGRKFLEEIDLDWKKQTDKYVKILNTLTSMLEEAETIYDKLIEKAESLKF